jgi:cell wall-associated NlpC family hydrolase
MRKQLQRAVATAVAMLLAISLIAPASYADSGGVGSGDADSIAAQKAAEKKAAEKRAAEKKAARKRAAKKRAAAKRRAAKRRAARRRAHHKPHKPKPQQPTAPPESTPFKPATIENGKAIAPAGAPNAVVKALAAGNKIRNKPYKWGGGHGKWEDNGYDCSGTVSYILHAAGKLDSPLTSGDLAKWGQSHRGKWFSVAANGGHTYIVVAGLRMDTSGTGHTGPSWFDSDVYTKTNGPFHWRHP